MTDLSIVIVTWNARDVLLDALASIAREVHPRQDDGRIEFLGRIDHQIKLVEATKRLGGRFCRVLTGQRYPDVTVEQGVAFAKECIEAVLPVAKELDVILSLENHYKDGKWKYPEFAQKKEVFLKVLEAIDEREYFGVQYESAVRICIL